MSSALAKQSMWVTVGVGVVGAAVLGYCVYFDHRRRSDPDFKLKLREKRRKATRQKKEESTENRKNVPDFNGDPTQAQAFFLQEVQLGEELLSEGDYEGAVEHLATAVMMCGQPQQLLQILNQTLPPQVFKMLLERLPIRRVGAEEVGSTSTRDSRPLMAEQELE